jgi:hypothetical protein
MGAAVDRLLGDPEPVDFLAPLVDLPQGQLGWLDIDNGEGMPVGHEPIDIGHVGILRV